MTRRSSSTSSSSSGSQNSLEISTPRAIAARPSGQVKWKANTKITEPMVSSTQRRPTENENSLGGFSTSGLAPLSPLPQGKAHDGTEEKHQVSHRAMPMGFMYSSPNLKNMQELASHYNEARLRDYYYQNNTARTSTFVDPLYHQLSSRPNNAQNKPVWSLNQPLPHVLDSSLVKKITTNIEAQSGTSSGPASKSGSKPGSVNPSRVGSMASISDWRKAFQRVNSGRKINDMEAQLPVSSAESRRSKAVIFNEEKHTSSQVELENDNSRRTHPGTKSVLNSDSYPNSAADDVPTLAQNSKTGSPPDIPPAPPAPIIIVPGAADEDGQDSGPQTFPNFWAKIRYTMREPFAEFLGTLILVIFGVGGNLQATVTNGAGGSFESLSFAWGFGVMLGVYVAGGVSGGHVNPVVTISMAIFRKFPWKKVPVYILAQIVGAFFGGAMAYGYFWSSVTEFEGGAHIRTAATGACLFTNPKSYVTWRNAFFDEFIGTAILVGSLMALLDDNNAPPTNGMTALIIGFLVAAIGMALGYQTSFTINPARDLGPRIFASMIGYGPHAFHLTHWWWTWGTWGGPIAGGITGALVYDIFVFTGFESPINYPDNGYIEHRVKAILQSEKTLQAADSKTNDIVNKDS
ncbi:LAME_0F00320g1_1 [Lachancea meyersii CBS 8951]|uniref:LAME_0F00320g1_1 n=1 Tax=Lachancea meyersii CBS 8951 TaxID=1266667 RepID=A0A1G4JPD5_9SACH|nr:LAME_0F00320g1_1 [Lachancea meyersii CBS 8951]